MISGGTEFGDLNTTFTSDTNSQGLRVPETPCTSNNLLEELTECRESVFFRVWNYYRERMQIKINREKSQ